LRLSVLGQRLRARGSEPRCHELHDADARARADTESGDHLGAHWEGLPDVESGVAIVDSSTVCSERGVCRATAKDSAKNMSRVA
ncbi:hypothetical protein DN536_34375, partial [Burkholderia multivorans]